MAREPYGALATARSRNLLDRLGSALAGLQGVRARIAAELVGRIRELTVRINQLEREIARLVGPLSGRLRQIVGVGGLTAAKLIGQTAGARRFGRSARFAMHTGGGSDPCLVRQHDLASAEPGW